MQLATALIHSFSGDDDNISPSISTTTNFDLSHPSNRHIYTRESNDTREALEKSLGLLEDSLHSLVFSSGLAAMHSLMMAVQPARIFISDGYHGSHQALNLYCEISSCQKIVISSEQEALEYAPFTSKDMFWIESPSNPFGNIWDIKSLSLSTKPAIVAVDATLLPFSKPLSRGASVSMQSATKFLGGHSDLLAGVLSTNDDELAVRLLKVRTLTGCILGNLETWLLLRSLKTLEVRFKKQSETALELIKWLETEKVTVLHASCSSHKHHSLALKLGMNDSPVFSILCKSRQEAEKLPLKLKFFKNATSFGGIESLVEWRFKNDKNTDERLVRFSIGLEDLQDLKQDLSDSLK